MDWESFSETKAWRLDMVKVSGFEFYVWLARNGKIF
jgi:hypothetical protein